MEAAPLAPALPKRILRPIHWPQTAEDWKQHEIARFESAYRRGDVRGVPTCFADLDEVTA